MYALLNKDKIVVGIEATVIEVVPQFSFVAIPIGTVVECGYVYQNSAFINPNAPDLPTMQQQQAQMLSRACAQQILTGFTSSALGVAHHYASTAIDQRNLILAAQSTNGGLLSCRDATSAWGRLRHTQAQAQQALEDFVALADEARTKLSMLEMQVTSANTVAVANTIKWEM